jgi:hypothetical protein
VFNSRKRKLDSYVAGAFAARNCLALATMSFTLVQHGYLNYGGTLKYASMDLELISSMKGYEGVAETQWKFWENHIRQNYFTKDPWWERLWNKIKN